MNKLLKAAAWLLLIALVMLPAGCGGEEAPSPQDSDCYREGEVCLFARAGERYFEVFDGAEWKKLTVKGVNIGTSLPGRWYTEFPADRTLYRRWLEEIAAMNANCVRLYTLLDPVFYSVLKEFNDDPATPTLWLLQEVWPHDEVPDHNFYDSAYREAYIEEIKLVVDALHGEAHIPARPYRAYGSYGADVTPYLLGILIGRELEPEEVEATDKANPGLDGYEGSYVVAAAGRSSPTETWLAEMCDITLEYSNARFGRVYPVGFVSWPTLDPLTHPTEWEADGRPGYNDRETVDPNVFSSGPLNPAGFFGAYHIYPNYPDFMNNEPDFAGFSDDEGVFRYRGYLHRFMEIHPAYPALVAEFGISTSLNTAHLNPEGLHHGGLSELDQGEMVARMMRSIMDEGYAGGVIFEWSDEWAKKTWNTEPFMVPWERQVLWQNAMCPEQNYGILAVEPEARTGDAFFDPWLVAVETSSFAPPEGAPPATAKIYSIEAHADEAFLHLSLGLDRGDGSGPGAPDWDLFGLLVGIDSGFREGGEFVLPAEGLPELPSGAQFLLHIASPDRAELLAVPSYNRGLLNFNPRPTRGGGFTRIETVVNRERETADGRIFSALYSDESRLEHGVFEANRPGHTSTAHWYVEEETGRVLIRLPWMLLNVADPSSLRLLRDDRETETMPGRDKLGTFETGGFIFYTATYGGPSGEDIFADKPAVIDFEPRRGGRFDVPPPYLWEGWEEPDYRFRLKESYYTIAALFGELE